jgi:hypothetical protein
VDHDGVGVRLAEPVGGLLPAVVRSVVHDDGHPRGVHAKEHWPQLGKLEVTCRGGFAYAAASLPADDKPQPLFRLRYGGSAHSFGFAVYSSATGRYENSVLLTGRHTGTPPGSTRHRRNLLHSRHHRP